MQPQPLGLPQLKHFLFLVATELPQGLPVPDFSGCRLSPGGAPLTPLILKLGFSAAPKDAFLWSLRSVWGQRGSFQEGEPACKQPPSLGP